jgi:hypothetical protein
MSKDNFIGGRVPQEVKRELKARAMTDGKTMQELLEEIIMGFLEGREEIKSMDLGELIDGIRQAIHDMEIPVPAVEPSLSEEEVEATVNTAISEEIEKVTDSLKWVQKNLEQRIEERLAAVKEDLEDAISDIENNMVYAEDDDDKPDDFTGFRKLMAEEVNCVIVSAFEDYLEEEDFDRVEVLRRISNQFLLEAEEDRSPECRDNFRLILPEDFAEEVGQVVRLAIDDMEFEDDKSEVFGKLYQLFEQAAVLALKKRNTIQLSLSETEFEAVDRLVASLAENKETVRDRRSLIRYLIGREMIREGEKSFWGDDELLVNTGKGMIEKS